MAESLQSSVRYAVVTGANKGIGLEICKQLASKGIMVVLTARDEKRGLEALQILKHSGLSDRLVFHQLDVNDPTSIDRLVDFVKKQFGKLDILVNNAAILGVKFDASKASDIPGTGETSDNILSKVTQTCETAEECLKTNYYGAKRMTEALIPLVQLSDLPRIVNLSSYLVLYKHVTSTERLKGVLEGLTTEEKLNDIVTEYLKDFKGGSLENKSLTAYILSKVALNAYTRILANKYPNICINSVCPGYVKTDLNFHTGTSTVEEGAENPVKVALLPNGGPSGLFFVRGEPASLESDIIDDGTN